eukprot:CAMPEP_0176226212 /NCGR_PEP_ID=MMETSP0121_2-20121125/22148_1 /TAXON_ID=160619 /ORGANISM="Kryptoperidinium foliaceum, Strain CCMP 1326" /LENGTH=166 /DNA_ID=CAMNT_0017565479 /DNA_START=69 /DNA_END=566 /DNA_ORIENTATION=-
MGDDLAPTLTPFGIGATIAQLGSGGLPAARPTKPVALHGHGRTGGFEGLTVSALASSKACRTSGRSMAFSQSAPSLSYTMPELAARTTGSGWHSPLAATRPHRAHRPWLWDDLRSERSVVRHREVGRVSAMLSKSSHANVADQTPLGVTENAYYRRPGLVHGDTRW